MYLNKAVLTVLHFTNDAEKWFPVVIIIMIQSSDCSFCNFLPNCMINSVTKSFYKTFYHAVINPKLCWKCPLHLERLLERTLYNTYIASSYNLKLSLEHE